VRVRVCVTRALDRKTEALCEKMVHMRETFSGLVCRLAANQRHRHAGREEEAALPRGMLLVERRHTRRAVQANELAGAAASPSSS
jgi:hypothetical protein